MDDTKGKRAVRSLEKWTEKAKSEGFQHVRSTKVNVANRKIGYGVEQTRINIRGGVKSNLNYNVKNSPGKKILRLILSAL